MEDTVDSIGPSIPSAKITITYPSGKAVDFGQELTPTEVQDTPQVSWDAAPTKFYTLIMYDADAPSRADPNLADIKHWLVVNIQGCDLNSGETLAEYCGSLPREGYGLHRYIFLVYEQKSRLEFDEPRSGKSSVEHRLKWCVKEFGEKYGLGNPYAGNYFVARWEPYVDEKRKEFYDNE